MSEAFDEFIFDGSARTFVAISAGAVAVFEVAGLDHKFVDDAVKWYAVIFAFFGESEEVFDGFGCFVFVQFDGDVAFGSFDCDNGVASGEHEERCY